MWFLSGWLWQKRLTKDIRLDLLDSSHAPSGKARPLRATEVVKDEQETDLACKKQAKQHFLDHRVPQLLLRTVYSYQPKIRHFNKGCKRK